MGALPQPFYDICLGQLTEIGGAEWALREIETPSFVEMAEKTIARAFQSADDDIMERGNTKSPPFWERPPLPPWGRPKCLTSTSIAALSATGEIPQRPLGYANIETVDTEGNLHRERVPLYKHGGESMLKHATRFKLLSFEAV